MIALLSFLEIRHHMDRIERDDCHQLRSGLHEMSNPQRSAVAGQAAHRGYIQWHPTL
jgi:hypothetical protein